MTAAKPNSLEDSFDLVQMEKAFKIQLNPNIDNDDIEEAFTNNDLAHKKDAEIELINKIIFEPHESVIEKSMTLKELYIRRRNSVSRHTKKEIICYIAYLLFAKPHWFEQNLELAEKIFNTKKFDENFFHKRRNDACDFFVNNCGKPR